MTATTPEPADLSLWRERQRAGRPTPWSERGIRFLDGDEVPALLDTSYLTEEDLGDPAVRANVRAMAETNSRIDWVAEYDDRAFAELMARARGLAAETDAAVADALAEGSTIFELSHPTGQGPGAFREARYEALLPAERAAGSEPQTEPDPDRTPVAASGAEAVASPVPEPAELPADAVRWRERATAGETAPWGRFGVRFLAAGELPSEVARSEARAAESGIELERIEAEATRATAGLATWVVESGDGVALGYWRGPEETPVDSAQIALLEPPEWFDAPRGRTLTDAMCLEFGEHEDELVAALAGECRALGFEVTADAYDDFPEPEADGPRGYRYEFKKRLEERALAAKIEAAETEAAERARRSAAAPRSAAVVTGDLLTALAALGHGADDAETQAVLALFGPPFERSHYPVGAVTRTYCVAERKHAELIFEDGVFVGVRIRIRSSQERGAYARPEGLIDGVGPDTTREQILERFGTPEWSNDHADRFWIADDAPNRVFVRFEYVDGRVADISATRESPEQ